MAEIFEEILVFCRISAVDAIAESNVIARKTDEPITVRTVKTATLNTKHSDCEQLFFCYFHRPPIESPRVLFHPLITFDRVMESLLNIYF